MRTSWVVTNKRDGRVFELFDRRDAEAARRSGGWVVGEIGAYLASINREVREPEDV